jgi:hypothetical protein
VAVAALVGAALVATTATCHFTGPSDTLLPAGTALLLAGVALVGITRYRARHARR